MHQAEKYIKEVVEQVGNPSYMQDFLDRGKDKQAIAAVAKKLQEFTENMSLLQPIAVKGFVVPSGSLMLYQYLMEDIDAAEGMLREDCESQVLPEEHREEMQKRVGIVRRRMTEMIESLLSQHIADQIEHRTDEKAAQSAIREQGFLPLYVDEKTMGIVYNTLTLQLLLDRFNLLFEGVFDPMDQETVKSVMTNVLVPYWKGHAQGILFSMEKENPA